MQERPGVLIVSASAGAGHQRAGEALREALLEREPGLRVEHVDILKLAPRWVGATYGGGFELVAAHAPWLWRQLYERTDGPGDYDPRWGPVATRILFREFRRLLRSGDWRLCLCTHFLPPQLAAGRPGLPPFAVAITDFTLHRYWIQPDVQHYFVATESLAAEVRRRARGARVDATGIPISPDVAAAPSREAARRDLGLDPDRPAVLAMGGGLGLGIEEMVDAALEARIAGLQVISICGRNEAARDRLLARGVADGRLRVYGFVRDVERHIAASDLVITKPGGLTTSEALALGRPLLLTRPIPGQEVGNTEALVRAGVALAATGPTALRQALEQAFETAGSCDRLSGEARRIGRPHAARTIAAMVCGEYLLDSAA